MHIALGILWRLKSKKYAMRTYSTGRRCRLNTESTTCFRVYAFWKWI